MARGVAAGPHLAGVLRLLRPGAAGEGQHRPARRRAVLIGALGLVSPGRADTLRFVTWSMLHDCVGEPVGTRTLLAFYEHHAAKV